MHRSGTNLPAGCSCGTRQALLQGHRPFRQARQSFRGQPRRRVAAAAVSCAGRSQHAHVGTTATGCWQCAGKAAVAALAALQLGGLPLALQLAAPGPAHAVLNSPNARIARSADAALRRAIPGVNEEVRRVQGALEDVAFKLRIPQRKPWPAMADDVASAAKVVSQRDKVLFGVPKGREAEADALSSSISDKLKGVLGAIDAKDADKVSRRVADVLQDVASLEILQAPGLTFSIPDQFAAQPRLTGRAKVELVIERKGAPSAFVDSAGGGPIPQARLGITLDGYSAPLTAGNFAANVADGVYNGRLLNASYASVLAGAGARGDLIPLEILPLGEFDPVYRSTLEVQAGELPVLPLSIYGSVAMAHASQAGEGPTLDGYCAADEFFIYKFSREQAGLSGLAFDEGTFGVFGFVTEGLELVPQLQSGDTIVSSRIVEGAERLVRPA